MDILRVTSVSGRGEAADARQAQDDEIDLTQHQQVTSQGGETPQWQ